MDTFSFLFLGSFVQSCCGEGGMLQTNTTGVCLQYLIQAGLAPARGTHCSGSTLLHQELSEASPRLYAPPQSKLLRFSTQVALRGADSVGTAFCALKSAVTVTYRLSRLCCSAFWVDRWHPL